MRRARPSGVTDERRREATDNRGAGVQTDDESSRTIDVVSSPAKVVAQSLSHDSLSVGDQGVRTPLKMLALYLWD
jgi:hypothetical protein